MPLSLEHSAFVIAANVPELERRYRRLAEEISLVASHLADTEPELAQLTKLRDEIEFAAENLKERSESAEVQAAAADLSSACSDLSDVLFDFRRHHNGSQSELDEPHPLGADMLNDLSDELGETWAQVMAAEDERLGKVFAALRGRMDALRKVMPSYLANFYDLGHFFATAPESVASLTSENRFNRVQKEIFSHYRDLYTRCCEIHPCLNQHFAESLDDERFQSAIRTQEQIVLAALKQLAMQATHASDVVRHADQSIARHDYDDHLPGVQAGWDAQIEGGIVLYDKTLTLPPQQALVLLRMIKARTKRLRPEDIACVDSEWHDAFEKKGDEEQKVAAKNIRSVVSRLRRSLCEHFGIDEDLREEVIRTHPGRPSVWELNWELLDRYGIGGPDRTQQ